MGGYGSSNSCGWIYHEESDSAVGDRGKVMQWLNDASDRYILSLALCLPCAVFFEAGASMLYGFLPALFCVFYAKVLATGSLSLLRDRQILLICNPFLGFLLILLSFSEIIVESESNFTRISDVCETLIQCLTD